jgi:ribA/ribD-fused uncharacterized protein
LITEYEQLYAQAKADLMTLNLTREALIVAIEQGLTPDYLFFWGHQKVLVEASPVDAIWGIGLAEENPQATVPSQWKGLNLLGFALMNVREQIRNLR